MMALAGVELETLVSEPDTLTTRPPPSHFAELCNNQFSNKDSCDALNDLPTLKRKILRVHARVKQV